MENVTNTIFNSKRKDVVRMNYQRIAEMVNELVTNPKSKAKQVMELSSTKLKMNEFTSIQSVFSKLEVSGGVLTFETISLDYW